jgi:tripartite-type tricarboxylate transporter receptor subunit TctC
MVSLRIDARERMRTMRPPAFILGLMLALTPLAAKADYPDHLVRISVPVAAGGGVDVMARLLAQKLGERLHQQFIVENRAGAAGVIGSRFVAGSEPDGYTLLYTPSSLSLAVAVSKTPPYDVAKDFTPIIDVAISPYALVVHSSVPADNLAEFLAYARANSGKLSFSSAGVGSASHLAGELSKNERHPVPRSASSCRSTTPQSPLASTRILAAFPTREDARWRVDFKTCDEGTFQ